MKPITEMQSYSFFGLAMPVGDFIHTSLGLTMLSPRSGNFISSCVSFSCKV